MNISFSSIFSPSLQCVTYYICVRDNLTVGLLVMGVTSSFFICGPDPRDVCLMATLYLTQIGM